MRKTIRHVAVLAAAVVMLTAIAVPAQGKERPRPTLDLFEVTCDEDTHYVTAVAAYETTKVMALDLMLGFWDASKWVLIDSDSVTDKGLLQVEVAGNVSSAPLHSYEVVYYLRNVRGETWGTSERLQGYC